MNKRSSLDAKVKQQYTLVEFKAGYSNGSCCPFIRLSNLGFNGITLKIDLKKSQYHFGMVVTAHVHM